MKPTDGCRFIAKFEKQRIPNEYLHLMAETEFKLESDEQDNPVWTFKNVKADKKRQILELLEVWEKTSRHCHNAQCDQTACFQRQEKEF